MDVFGALAGTFFLLAIPLAILLVVVIPVWAIIDVLQRDDDKTTRVLWGVAIIFCLGGFGAVLYALVGTRSSGLRKTAIVGLLGVPVLLVAGGFSLHRAEEMNEALTEAEIGDVEVAALPSIQPTRVGTFVASRRSDGARRYQVGEFGMDGPLESTLRPVDVDCEWVALDTRRQQHYCLSWRGLTAIDFERELTTKLPGSEDDDFSHLAGIAYDASKDRLLVTANTGAGGFLFAYAPAEGDWDKIAELHTQAKALAVSPEDGVLYVIPASSRLTSMRRYNSQGAAIGDISLDPPLVLDSSENVQLIWTDGWLVVARPRAPEHDRGPTPLALFAIDPESGRVYEAADNDA